MKRALVLTSLLVLVLGLGTLAAGPFSGYWSSELTIGFKDVTITDPGATLTIPGGTYSVSQGYVTVGSQVVTGTYLGESYTVTVPGGTYWVGPWDLTIPGGTYDVTDATVTIPAQEVPVQLPDGECTATVGPFSFEIPDFHNKIADIAFPVEDKEVPLPLPEVFYLYGGTVGYSYTQYLQTSSTVLQEGTGELDLEDLEGLLSGLHYNCGSMCWEYDTTPPPYPTVDLPGFHRELHPDGKTFQIDIDPETVVVKCDDATQNGFVLLVGRTGSGEDSLGNVVEIIIEAHTLDFEIDLPETVAIPDNWAYTPDGFEGHYLVFEIPGDDYPITWPEGWNRCCDPEQEDLDRPFVTVGLEDLDVYVYQVTGEVDETDEESIASSIFAAIDANDLDKLGLCLLGTTGSDDYEFPLDNIADIPFGDLVGEALLGSYEEGTETITIPEQTVTCTCEGEEITIVVPAQDVTVTGQTVTIPDISITVPADSIEIPDYTFTITVDDQDIDITIPGGTYAVSAQTVTIPSRTVTVPGWSQTISRLLDLGFTSTLSVDYTVCNWTFNSTSKFADEDGWTSQSFSAEGDLGAFSISSDLDFDPPTASFERWETSVGVSIAGVTFGADFVLVPDKSGFSLSASGTAGNCNLGATANFNLDSHGDPITGNCVCFTSVEFDFDFSFACIELVEVELDFTASGFGGITFAVSDVTIPNIPWLSFDIEVTFDDGVTGKEVSVKPSLSFGKFDCITLYGGLLGTFPEITGFNVYGAKLSYSWNGMTFTDVTVFDYPDYYVTSSLSVKKGSGQYWEALQLKFDADACCGGGFDFSVTTFFENDSAILFDWGESTVAFSMGIGSNYTVSTSLTIDDMGLELWKLGFKVTF